DRGGHVGYAVYGEEQDARQGDPGHHTADRHDREQGDGRPRGKASGHRGSDREAVDQERAGVVEEAFTLEDDEQPMRGAPLLEHGGSRGGVGWSDDGAERD